MHGYRKTFKRRWPLYLLPPLLAAAALGFLSFSAPKSYESNASLWVDYSASSASSLNVTPTSGAAELPSTAEQTLLTELVGTKQFDDAVAAGAAGVAPSARAAVSDSIPTAVTSTVPGPQILQVNYKGSSALGSQQIVSSLIGQLQVWTTKFSQRFNSAAARYNETLYTSADKAVASAKAAVNTYRYTHRRATTENDQTYASLVAALSVATSSLTSARAALNQASAQSHDNGSTATVSVVDQASLPTAPVTDMKKILTKVIGGVIGGGLISFLLIIAFTPSLEDSVELSAVAEGAEPVRARLSPPLQGTASSQTRPVWSPQSSAGAPPPRGLPMSTDPRPGGQRSESAASDGSVGNNLPPIRVVSDTEPRQESA
jgi:uncharacterized protein involved in exopolysaccharide biosynthesis